MCALAFACAREPANYPHLGVTIEFPLTPMSKANVGEVPASEAENTIYDLIIWVFNNDTHDLEASYETSTDFPEGGGVRKYSLVVKPAFAEAKPDVDVFVLINSDAFGTNINLGSSWGDVYNAVFGGDEFFSPDPDNLRRSVPNKGLPMSGASLGLKIDGEEPSFTLPSLSVGRAVSKLRYLFCQMLTENNTEESFAIQKVVLDGGQIPSAEYVFSENLDCRIATSTSPVYDPREITTLWPDGKALEMNDTPELFSYAGQDGPTYEAMITQAVQDHKITDMGTLYLRESDKALTGTVYYSITKKGQNGDPDVTTEKQLPFSMAAPGDFARNHTWYLYGYFISNRTLQLAVNALPWDKNNYTIRFDQSTLQVTQKFTVDPASATVVRIGQSNEYNVFLDPNKPAKGYIYVTTPQGGTLEITPVGDAPDVAAFTVSPEQATIDPTYNSGRIDITIDRKESGVSGKTITLSFEAYTPDERKIAGASECIDQIYHFHL